MGVCFMREWTTYLSYVDANPLATSTSGVAVISTSHSARFSSSPFVRSCSKPRNTDLNMQLAMQSNIEIFLWIWVDHNHLRTNLPQGPLIHSLNC